MSKRIDSQFSTKVDVENVRDFYQYYKGRYFGFEKTSGGPILPCLLDQNRNPGDRGICLVFWDKENNCVAQESRTLAEMNKGQYRFGAPTLGTATFGPSYAYVEGHSLRESIKGIAISKFQIKVPNENFVLKKYIAKEAKLGKMLGGSFGSPEEMEFVYEVYNKKYYTWNEAIELLERGDRLGCQLSKHAGIFLDEQEPNILLSYKHIPGIAKVIFKERGTYALEVNERFYHLKPILEHILYPLNDTLTIK